MLMKRLAEHLGGTLWFYFGSVAAAYAFFSWALVAVMESQVSEGGFGTYGVVFLLSSLVLLLVLFGWPFVFMAIFRELYKVLFPQELLRGPPVGIRGMRPGYAVGALKAISSLDPFRRVFTQAAVPVSLLAVGELVLLIYFREFAIPLFALFFAIPVSLYALSMPSTLSRYIPPSQRLLSILSIFQFLRSRQADLTQRYSRSMFLFDMMHIIRNDERFVVRKASSYLNDFITEVAPAATVNLTRYWATLYAAMSLKVEEDSEFQQAANTIESMRRVLEGDEDSRAKVNQLLSALTLTKDVLPDSWRMVEEKNISIEVELPLSPQDLQRSVLSVISVIAAFIGLLRVLLFK
jgi:hypothetical protein